jgi:hypothetical protein
VGSELDRHKERIDPKKSRSKRVAAAPLPTVVAL